MSRFRKKPITIDAFQMTKETRTDNSNWPEWLHEAWEKKADVEGALYLIVTITGESVLFINTLEGKHLVSFNDWIIQGIKGELYSCKPDIFRATYELIV